jgi:hypothetical protein
LRTVGAVAIAVVVSLLVTLVLMLGGAFTLRTALGAARYRDLGLPVVVIGGAVAGGIGLGVLSFLRIRSRD